VLKLFAAASSVVCLSACTALTGDGRASPVGPVSIFQSQACYVRNTSGEFWQVPCEGAIRAATACYVSNGLWNLQEVACPRRILRTTVKRRARTQEE
jgi:hypothetical protein